MFKFQNIKDMYFTDYSQIPLGPILRPTRKEFKNFREYVNKIENDPELADCGMVKVE